MKNKFLKIITFILLVSNIFFYPVKTNAQDKSILFISSYSPGFTSFNDQVKGLSDELDSKYDLQIEYMDGKKFKSAQSEETFYNLLKFKIKNYKKFDAIILGDDMALNFGLKYKDSLFDDIPIVFFGVSEESNIKKAKELNVNGGIIESPSISENLGLINRLYPKKNKEKRNLVLITGDTKKYKKEINEFYSFKDSYKQFNFKYLPMPSEINNDFLNDLSKLNFDKDIVFFLYPYRDGAGKSISVEKSIDIINENIKSPIFTNLSYDIYKNMIGGKVINHYEQGKEAAKLINDILSNKISSPKFINNSEANIWMFNYDNLKKNNISLNSIPKESTIINKPTPFLIKYKGLILPISFTILGFILIIVALLLRSMRNKKYQDELMRAKQLAEDANNAKSNFISNISHELRTPVAVISSSNQLLRKINNNTNDNIDNTLDIIDQNANRLIRLINNIIDIAKIDSGFGDLNLKNIDVITLIEDTVLSVIPYAISKDLEIVFDTTAEELIMAVDSEKIERIVLNLLSNAIKFSKSNSKILANIVVKDKLLIFIVKDFGIGIDDKNLSKIFDKFTQIDDSFTKYNEGSGIGLSIVKSFVDLHGGTISVDSKINKGSTFKVSIPIKIIEEFDTASGDSLSNVNIELSDIIR